jgi:hypothetical protein
MKTTLTSKRVLLYSILPCILIAAMSFSAYAQEKKQETAKQAKIVMKINNDKGKNVNIDTTFTIADAKDQKAFEEYMKTVEVNFTDVEEGLQKMNITVEIPDLDSLPGDSVRHKVICITKGGKSMVHCKPGCPEMFEYKFDMECDGEKAMAPGCCEKFLNFNHEGLIPTEGFQWMPNNNEQTLGGLLGDIPMSRVKSYKIQDKKNGKRIIIDIEDAPIMPEQKEVIIIRR